MKKILLIIMFPFFVMAAGNSGNNSFQECKGICKEIGSIKPPSVGPNDTVKSVLESIGISYKLGDSSRVEKLLSNPKHYIPRALCVAMPQLEDAVSELREFVENKTYILNKEIIKEDGIPVMFIHSTLEFYNSKEYQEEIERIIDKYCSSRCVLVR